MPPPSRRYFVWRRDGRQIFRTYRQSKRRAVPLDLHCLWSGEDRSEGLSVQRQANALIRLHRRKDHPDQVLLPGLFPGPGEIVETESPS